MRGFALRLLGGPGGGPILAAVLGAFAVSVAGWTIQTHRVDRLKDDVREAKAALLVPGTKVTWKTQAERAGRDFSQCALELQGAAHQLGVQNAAVEALKADGDRRARELASALQAARNQALAAQSAADRIASARLESEDTCKRLLEIEAVITGNSR